MLVGDDAELIEKSVMPNFLHVIPIVPLVDCTRHATQKKIIKKKSQQRQQDDENSVQRSLEKRDEKRHHHTLNFTTVLLLHYFTTALLPSLASGHLLACFAVGARHVARGQRKVDCLYFERALDSERWTD